MLGQFTGEEQPDGGLDFPGGDGGTLVVVSKTGGFGSDALEDVVDKGVHDGHGLGADTSVGVDLLQDLVDVDRVGFLPLLAFLLAISLGDGLGGLAGLLGSFTGGLGWHDCCVTGNTSIRNLYGARGSDLFSAALLAS